MKKSVLAMLAATSIVAIAQAAITSSQVVGYQSIPVINGFNMIAFNFQPVDGSEDFAITDFISNKEDLIAGNLAGDSDRIQVWNGSEFTTYYYRAYKATNPNKFTAGPAWVKVGAIGTVTTDKIPRGAGIWFARPATAPEQGSIVVSGAINATAYTHDITAGFNMISSAFPVDMPLNTLTAEENNGVAQTCPIDWAACGAVAGNLAGDSDRIQVWNGTEFTTYYYRAYKASNPNKFTAGPAWVKVGAIGTKTADKIPAGKGFWYARPGTEAGSLIETSPLAVTSPSAE